MQRLITDRSVRTKIMFVVAALGAVTALVAVLAVSRLGAVYGTADELVTGSLRPQTQLAKVQVDVQKSRIQIRDILMATGAASTDEAVRKMADGDRAMDADVDAYLRVAADPGAMQAFHDTWDTWRAERDAKLVPAAKAKDLRTWNQVVAGVTAFSTQAAVDLDKAEKAETARAQQNIKGASSVYTSARTMLIGFVLVGLLLALAAAEYVTRRIVGPLREVSGVLGRIAEGDVSGRATVSSRDELGTMAAAVNTATTSIEALVTDSRMLAQAAAEGQLDRRADGSRHQGDFRAIVDGVNATLDSLVGPLEAVSRVLKAVEDGDLTQTVRTPYKGQLEQLRQAVNNTVSSLALTFGEVGRVLKAVEDGDLTQTVTTQLRGQFEELRQATNSTVTRLSQTVAEVMAACEELGHAAGQVSGASQSLSQAATEQAASVEQTSASVEEMAASVNQNSENAKVTDGIASKTAADAAEGGAAVQQTVEVMKEIAGKIAIIDDIAFQTNMLALNATIEAARAGEHGKGFAVVATEVGKLAERSQVAAQEISEMAGGSVRTAEKAGGLLDQIVPSIRRTSDLVQEIAAASAEQTSGVMQINSAMSQMSQITQQNASSSEELAATAEEMMGQTSSLQRLMEFFRTGDGSRRPASEGPPAQRPFARPKVPPAQVRRDAPAPFEEAKFERF